jgi:hypothetical protein
MAHLVQRDLWGVTDLDLEKGHVFVRQDWRYHWVDNPALPPWTADERFHFHRRLDHVIWAHWSLRARLHVRAAHARAQPAASPNDLVTRFGAQGLTLSFDVRSVVGPAHWQASVLKVDSSRRPFPQSHADFARRTLDLHSCDVEPHFSLRKAHDPLKQSNFFVAAHEFGHAIGYANPRGHIEEYDPTSPFYEDVHSVMNIGRRIRARHLSLITETLEKMVRGARFEPAVGSR